MTDMDKYTVMWDSEVEAESAYDAAKSVWDDYDLGEPTETDPVIYHVADAEGNFWTVDLYEETVHVHGDPNPPNLAYGAIMANPEMVRAIIRAVAYHMPMLVMKDQWTLEDNTSMVEHLYAIAESAVEGVSTPQQVVEFYGIEVPDPDEE